MSTTALAERLQTSAAAQQVGKGAKNSVLDWLNADTTKGELVKALPRGMDAGRFARIVQTEVRKNPQLLECTPQSFILSVLNAAQLGLEPGPLGHSYLIPYRDNRRGTVECQLQLGYKGLKELAYRGGTIDLMDAIAVHEGEPFRIHRGSDARIDHEELAECADNPVVAYYAIAYPKGSGRPVFEVMWPKDIDDIRKRSRASDKGPWVTDFEAMALKTVTRRLCNRGKVRLTADVAAVIAEDEARDLGFDKPQFDISVPAIDGKVEDAIEAGKAGAVAADGTDGVTDDVSEETARAAELLELLEAVPEDKRWSAAMFTGKLTRGYEKTRAEIIELRRKCGVEPADPAEAETGQQELV